YLRARYYNPTDGRFISRDTWSGDMNNPLSLNRWNYTHSNPINYTDPTGYYVCTNPLPASCQTGLSSMHATASVIKELVRSGAWLPVDGFASFASFSQNNYFSNIRDLVWAMTIILDDMDANRGDVWRQATGYLGSAGNPNFIKEDWLPYKTAGEEDWCFPEDSDNCWHKSKWVHSLRGDWRAEYWDKTANQAYHFWFYVAVAFFDNEAISVAGNLYHDKPPITFYDFVGSDPYKTPPLPSQSTLPDIRLGLIGTNLGLKLRFSSWLQEM